jgi:PBP1b-binding outer membrane lipoprotein LpoB
MKRFLVMILFILLLTGCGETPNSQEKESINMFVYIHKADLSTTYDVVYHKDTKVMYTISQGAYNSGTFTLLVNPDGTPMLYEGE